MACIDPSGAARIRLNADASACIECTGIMEWRTERRLSMRQGSLFPCCDDGRSQPGRHGCCRPCCGYIVEEIHSHHQERCCFRGMLEICGLPARLAPPLTLCRADVSCISPLCGQERAAFCLTLRCEVEDCRGCRACGEACICITLQHAPACCGENLRLGARLDVQHACFCAPSAFEVCADVHLMVVTSGVGRMLRQLECAPRCAFAPLYPAPLCGKTAVE